MDNIFLMEVLDTLDDGSESIENFFLPVSDDFEVPSPVIEEWCEVFTALLEEGSILVEDGPEQIGVGEVRKCDDTLGELMERVRLAGVLVN